MFDPHVHYTLEDYWKLVETFPKHKYEYIDGQIRMMTGGSPAHGQIANRIGGILDAALRNTDCNVYSSDVALQLTDFRTYYPDISVSCDPADWTRTKAIEAPSIIVEVLSPSTAKTDRGEKLLVYQQYPTVQDILFVDSRKYLVEHHHRIASSKWEHIIYTQQDDILILTSIDLSISLHEIYFKVYLELEETK